MCEQQYQAEVLDEECQLDEEGQKIDLAEMVFQMGVYMNEVRRAELQADLPPHKCDWYMERMYEQADMLRKARRENGL